MIPSNFQSSNYILINCCAQLPIAYCLLSTSPSMRYLFEITYKGTYYHGWQSQVNAVGIQQIVEESLGKLLRERISIVGSGRTDTGVHCVQQFFHSDINKEFTLIP